MDFTDYLALGVGWGFESGFSGFRGFFSVRRWIGVLNQDFQDFEDFLALGVGLGGCVPQHKINENVRFSFRRCDDRSD